MKKTTMKPKTIEELAGKPPGSFKQFNQKKAEYLKKLEDKRQKRIHAAQASRANWTALAA